ncbi:hypothetical protein F7725_000253 [Dissostichus mawsoni]|uniref:Uncharacterized protein n=1 Tax=Dissostichus mawsoni TaxID=36200 RepID=A0A7J5ZHX1_DISMA|nr:hypothetical protein F7725_000253 [Dissostichus mawsoni]
MHNSPASNELRTFSESSCNTIDARESEFTVDPKPLVGLSPRTESSKFPTDCSVLPPLRVPALDHPSSTLDQPSPTLPCAIITTECSRNPRRPTSAPPPSSEAYQDHVKSYKEALSRTRSSYYSTLIGNQQYQPRMLFSTINRLLRPLDPPHPPGALDLCSKFLD